MNEEELQLYKYLNGLISYPFTRNSRNKILEIFSDLLNENKAYENMRKEVLSEIEYFELQAQHLNDDIYLDEKLTQKLKDILNKVGGSDE